MGRLTGNLGVSSTFFWTKGLGQGTLPSMQPSNSSAGHTNGETASSLPVSPCPFESFAPEVHQYIHVLESRIKNLETTLQNFAIEQNKNRERMRGLGKIFFNGPARMFVGALPKEFQKELEEFFGDGN